MVIDKVLTKDGHPAIMVKGMILARSGIYVYSHAEMIARGAKIDKPKAFYREFRPADVIVRAKDKFAFSVITREHTADQTDANNFRMQAAGVVGDHIDVVPLDDGEIALQAKGAFYTRDAADYFEAGNRETSADYQSVIAPAEHPEYDFILKDILSVNGVALTAKGRGGQKVRVLDSAIGHKSGNGGYTMPKPKRSGILGFIGIGRAKDANFKLSTVVMDQLKGFDPSKIDESVQAVMQHITPLGDREEKDMLISAVTDCFSYPVQVQVKEKEVSETLDTLYSRCIDADDADAKKFAKGKDGDGKDKTGEEGAEKDKKEGGKTTDAAPTQDIQALVEAAVTKALESQNAAQVEAMKRVTDSLDSRVDQAVRKALGLGEGGESGDAGESGTNRALDSALFGNAEDDGSFIAQHSMTFGR